MRPLIEIPKEWIIGIVILAVAMFIIGIVCGGSLGYWKGMNSRRPVINLKVENATQELYPALERQEVFMNDDQKKSFENDVRRIHRKAGFKN